MDALEGISEEECEHTPDQLYPFDLEYEGDKVLFMHRCEKCGKEVVEVFSFSEWRIS